jgi:hypothetical protein
MLFLFVEEFASHESDRLSGGLSPLDESNRRQGVGQDLRGGPPTVRLPDMDNEHLM